MLKKLIKTILKKEPDRITVNVEYSEQLLMVRLAVNDQLSAWMQCVVQSETTILIGDIRHHKEGADYNKGYGTRMMEELLSYAREHHFDYVYGNLSEVDLGHKDRLQHFYQKFGFTITEYPEPQGNYYGKIELYLQKDNVSNIGGII